MSEKVPPEISAYMRRVGEIGRQHRQPVPQVCPVCGTTFARLRHARYCSRACQQKAYLQRKAADRGVSGGTSAQPAPPATPAASTFRP